MARAWTGSDRHLGASAGGHLSLLQATSPGAGNPASGDPVERVSGKVQAVACFFPPTDFLNWGKPGQVILQMPNIGPFMAAFDFKVMDKAQHVYVSVSDARRLEMFASCRRSIMSRKTRRRR